MGKSIGNLGDVIIRESALGLRHYGIIIGYDDDGWPIILHITPKKGLVSETLLLFLNGKAILGHRPFSGELATLERRLKSVSDKYNAFTNNCEHLANFLQTGKAESKQVSNIILLTLIFLI